MSDEVKENTLVRRISPAGTPLIARVRWVNEKGEAGVTYIAPDSYKDTAQVVDIDELEVIQEDMGEDLKLVPTKELVAAITRLRGTRLPKKPATRKASVRKQSTKSKLDAVIAEGGEALNELIAKAVEELKEEEENK